MKMSSASWRRSDPAGRPRAVLLWNPRYPDGFLADELRRMGWDVALAMGTRPVALPHDYDVGFNFLAPWTIAVKELGGPSYRRWVNFHRGPLPQFRGRCAPYFAVMEHWPCFAVSVHYMDTGLDTGDVIEVKESSPATDNMTAGDLIASAHVALVDLFLRWAPRLLRGPVPAWPQVDLAGVYYPAKAFGSDEVELDRLQSDRVRALTVETRRQFARVVVAGRTYRVVPEECL